MKKELFAGVRIIQEGKILLVQESHFEARGLWSIPLGHLDEGESIEECAKREALEETGLEVNVFDKRVIEIPSADFKSTSEFNASQIELHVFSGSVRGEKIKLGNVLDVQWVPLEKIPNLPLRGTWMNEVIKNL